MTHIAKSANQTANKPSVKIVMSADTMTSKQHEPDAGAERRTKPPRRRRVLQRSRCRIRPVRQGQVSPCHRLPIIIFDSAPIDRLRVPGGTTWSPAGQPTARRRKRAAVEFRDRRPQVLRRRSLRAGALQS
jgi:hypothetical protein